MEPEEPRKTGGDLTPIKSLFTICLVFLCFFFPFGFHDNSYANILIMDLLLVIVIAWLLRLFRLPFERLDFHRMALTEYLLGIGTGLLLIALTFGLSILSETIFGTVSDEINRAYELLKPEGWVAMVILGTEIIIIAPFLEEILFRAIIFRGFRSYGFWPAALLTSFIYAVFFPIPWATIPVIVMSVILCWVYEKTGNLTVVLVAHVLANIIVFLELAGVIAIEI